MEAKLLEAVERGDYRRDECWRDLGMKREREASRNHEAATVESFRKDPQFAVEYLIAVLEDGDPEELLLAIHRVTKVCGEAAKENRRP